MKKYIDLLIDLIQLRPLSDHLDAVNRAQERLCRFLQDHGVFCTLEEYEGRLVLYGSNTADPHPDLLFNAHLDVVPAADESQFFPRIEKDWIIARGAGDCLGNAVCIAKVLCEAAPGTSVGAIFTADEEIGGETTRIMAEKHRAKKLVCLLDYYDDDNICFAQKGTMNLELSATGKSAHASMPWTGDNAIDKLIDGWTKVRALWKNPTAEDSWHSSITTTVLEGGVITNQVPDTAKLYINIRCITAEEMEELPAWIAQTSGLTVKILSSRAPVTVRNDDPALDQLGTLMKKHFWKPVKFSRIHGATDACFFAPFPAPVAIFGIRSTGEHSSDERASLTSLRQYSEMLCELAELL